MRLQEEGCRTKSELGGKEERPSQLEQTRSTPLPSSPLPLHDFFNANCLLLTGPLPQTAELVTQQADHRDQLFQACYSDSLPPARSHSHLPLDPVGLTGAAQNSQQTRRTTRAKGFPVCPQLATKDRAAHLCLHLYQHPPPRLTVLQLLQEQRLPAHTPGNPWSDCKLCYRHQSVTRRS